MTETTEKRSTSFATVALWGIACLASLAAGAYCLSHILEYETGQFIELAIAIVVTALLGQHQFRIPKTSSSLRIREMSVFWAILSLGLPGAILVSACASITSSFASKRGRMEIFLQAVSDTLAAGISAIILFVFLRMFEGLPLDTGIQTASWSGVSIGIMVLLSCHYLTTALIASALSDRYRFLSTSERIKRSFTELAPTYALGLFGGALFYFAFGFFGATFGWAVFPAAIFTHFAYRIYEERLEVKTREVREASRVHLATVEALATAIDARDQVGMGHVRRTQIYALGLGEVLGLSSTDMEALKIGALLHDIGKLAIPDHILNKPGKLTPAELEKTKIHPAVGAQILEKVNFEYPVVPTVKYHHESWDGAGYPEGLRGEQIPLTARILTVADAYDTLRGARPYRPPVGREEARRILLNGAGIQFDPKIVDTFLRNLREFETRVQEAGLGYQGDEVLGAVGEHGDAPQGYVDQIKRANREVFTLYELARIFTASLTLEDTLALFARKIRELVPFDTCSIFLFEDGDFEARAVYTEGKHAAALQGRVIRPGDGATGFALRKRQPVLNANPSLDFSFSHQEFVEEYTALASLPLIANERLLGAVTLYSCTLSKYEDEHVRLLETVSKIASDALLKSLYYAETESRALTDPMTGLPNARSLAGQFEKEVARAARKGAGFQVLMLDLDGFKAVNDTFGHKVGDQLLKGVSKVMLGQLRDYDFLARYAGDEFVAIIPDAENRSVNELCMRIERAVENYELVVGEGKVAKVGVSLGAAAFPQSGESLDQIIIAADKAMYRIKAFRKQQLKKDEPKPVVVEPQTNPNEKMVAVQILDDYEVPVRKNESPTILSAKDIIIEPEVVPDEFVVELDESHIIHPH